jgi:integrase
VVQDLLGHSTIAVTLDTYSHVAPGLHREAVQRLDLLFGTQYRPQTVASTV